MRSMQHKNMIISRGKINVLFDNKRFLIMLLAIFFFGCSASNRKKKLHGLRSMKSSSSIKTVLTWRFVSFALPVALIAYVISLDENDSIVDNFPLGDDAMSFSSFSSTSKWWWKRRKSLACKFFFSSSKKNGIACNKINC